MAHCERRHEEGGFTYLGALFAVALIGLSLGAVGTVASLEARRQREQQLLWVGEQYRAAIASYYEGAGLGSGQYPLSLQELLEDHRGPTIQRHLRRLYPDPMTGAADWEIIRTPDGQILGVASMSKGRPIKKAGFEAANQYFEEASCYCDWRFLHLPQLVGQAARQVSRPD